MRDLIVSMFQSVFLTLSMLYSYYFYKDNLENIIFKTNKSSVDVINKQLDETTNSNLNEKDSN